MTNMTTAILSLVGITCIGIAIVQGIKTRQGRAEAYADVAVFSFSGIAAFALAAAIK